MKSDNLNRLDKAIIIQNTDTSAHIEIYLLQKTLTQLLGHSRQLASQHLHISTVVRMYNASTSRLCDAAHNDTTTAL